MKQSHSNLCRASLWGALLFVIVGLLPLVGLVETVQAGPAETSAAAAAKGCEPGKKCVFLPALLSAPATPVDLTIGGVEVTQGIQDASNSVPLVAGRKTVLRIFARASGTSKPVSNVRVVVAASRMGTTLSSSPAELTTSIPLANDRADLDSTINIDLPEQWVTNAVDLTVRVDPDNRVSEVNETNNSYTLHLKFSNVPALKVKVVPIAYTHTPDGHTYPAPTESANKEKLASWILKVYPISELDLDWRSPYSFTGDLRTSAEFNRLLREVTSLKSSDGAPGAQVYYALVPTIDGNSSWFSGGVAGIGWIGSRAAAGLNISSASQIAAHEIGHNLGMYHTPCGSPSGLDPNYPYQNASIGQFGLDVFAAEHVLYTPNSAKDVMSYCSPRWISDYTYKRLYDAHLQTGASMSYSLESPASPGSHQRSLLVRAHITRDGVSLLPSYVLPGQQTGNPEAGEWTVQVLNGQDEVLAQAPVRAYEIEIEGEEGDLAGIDAMIPLPDQPVAKMRLVKDDQVVAEQPLQDVLPGQTQRAAIAQVEGGLNVQWVSQESADRPVIVRYSADNGLTWTTLGVDVTGGAMQIDPALLPAPGGIFEIIPSGN